MNWLKRCWRDTLFKRLFILLWVTLVGSHFLAFSLVMSQVGRPDVGHEGGPAREVPSAWSRLLIFPSLPPMGGRADGPPRPPEHVGPPSPPQVGRAERGLPGWLLALDYGVRMLIIALAAWLGAAWLSRPMRRLSAAAHGLGEALQRDAAPPKLDEDQGTVEVREAAQVFNQMAGQLQQQFKARGLLVAAISHDLRTPLTRMRLRLETLDHEPAAQRCVADIHEMDALIESVLQVFRGAHAGEAMVSVDVLALAQSLADDLVEQGHSLTVHGGPALACVQPTALRRVLGNLLGNALRYGERAELTVAVQGDRVLLRIDDQGPGIPEAQLEAVFQPFYRVESSRNRATGGSGLGLYIARDLTLRQGGELRLSNRPEGGLRAELSLRRA
ncbi:ATP-binding protein [Roseateles toxinivorans]|uniref:histidine kinase n=1 Tax=Roseateles toxinivorans TaxID=270368 RepID=A0A4R6QIZ3_9BURK|nr:ATP-binding protein [Roseateles toxinivorans]TDP63490.1 signal transduction histidine kinase [Roseateles toxinivorans]